MNQKLSAESIQNAHRRQNNLNSKHRHSVTGSGHRVKSVRVGSGHGSKVQTRFQLFITVTVMCVHCDINYCQMLLLL